MAKTENKEMETKLNEEAKTELAVHGQQGELMSSDQSQKYYSIVPETRKEAVAIYNAVNNPDERLANFINKEIEVEHILIENVEIVNEETGINDIVPRTVFIDKAGVSYVAVSFGIFNSTKRIVQMFGEPSEWEAPVTVEVKQIKKGQNSILTLNLIG